jgi:hypothetical protein
VRNGLDYPRPPPARTARVAQSFHVESIDALASWWSMIFSENRFPLSRIMLYLGSDGYHRRLIFFTCV